MKRMNINPAERLHTAGLKATPGRISLIEILEKSTAPQTITEISEQLPRPLNEVTVYRALDALTEAKIVRRVGFNHGHAHFELVREHDHHHHLVCTQCARVEDFSATTCERLAARIVHNSRAFAAVSSHSMELFGICKTCAAAGAK
jgi:Fur family ferric uptake transcriptional regulator